MLRPRALHFHWNYFYFSSFSIVFFSTFHNFPFFVLHPPPPPPLHPAIIWNRRVVSVSIRRYDGREGSGVQDGWYVRWERKVSIRMRMVFGCGWVGAVGGELRSSIEWSLSSINVWKKKSGKKFSPVIIAFILFSQIVASLR